MEVHFEGEMLFPERSEEFLSIPLDSGRHEARELVLLEFFSLNLLSHPNILKKPMTKPRQSTILEAW